MNTREYFQTARSALRHARRQFPSRQNTELYVTQRYLTDLAALSTGDPLSPALDRERRKLCILVFCCFPYVKRSGTRARFLATEIVPGTRFPLPDRSPTLTITFFRPLSRQPIATFSRLRRYSLREVESWAELVKEKIGATAFHIHVHPCSLGLANANHNLPFSETARRLKEKLNGHDR